MKIKFYCQDGGIHKKLGQVFHRDAKALGPDAARYNRYMCGVLTAVAQSHASCDSLLNFIDDIQTGKSPQIETGGNDVTLTMTPAGVHVDIEINEEWIGQPEANFTLDEWRRVLTAWRHFLSIPQSFDAAYEIEV